MKGPSRTALMRYRSAGRAFLCGDGLFGLLGRSVCVGAL